MNTGKRDNVTGYLGERAVERFFLLKGYNFRCFDFDAFDGIIIVDRDIYKCQIKTTAKGTIRLGKGRSRKIPYEPGEIDLFAFVDLDPVNGTDRIWFYTLDEMQGKLSMAVSKLDMFHQGEAGWKLAYDYLKEKHKCSTKELNTKTKLTQQNTDSQEKPSQMRTPETQEPCPTMQDILEALKKFWTMDDSTMQEE